MRGSSADVAFDFDGALELARLLWGLAEEVEKVDGLRRSLAASAGVDFTGVYAREFAGRMADETSACSRTARGLRDDATACARLWKDAMDEQNRRLYGRHVDDMKANRSIGAKIGDLFTGFEYPPEPDPVALPVPPRFLATGDFVRYR